MVVIIKRLNWILENKPRHIYSEYTHWQAFRPGEARSETLISQQVVELCLHCLIIVSL